ncbi:Synaptotagmin-15-like 1, partial [Homarus americanus]
MLGAHEKTHWRDGAHETMSPAMMGGLVVGVSLAGALLFCTALCLGLWCRRLRGHAGDPSPATFLVSKRKPGPYAPPDHPMAFVMPTITHSEAGSEPRTPPPTMTLSPTPTERSKGLGSTTPTPTTTPEHHGLYCPIRDGGVTTASTFSSSSFPVTFSLPPTYTPLHPPTYTPFHLTTCTPLPTTTTTTTSPLSSVSPARPRSASPHGFLRTSPHTPSLSLPLGSRRWWPGPQCSPGTPPALLPRNLYARKGTQGLEELRSAFQHPFLTSDPLSPDPGDVTTPDSVDGWGPVWTPASSIGSGGGCGLGELRVRLRYSIRSRLLRLTVLSADQLPLRLGPDPVDTYTKVFNAAFTHAARPSRLAHATLRLSVCQVTDCGRRVVVGYASVGLASTGLRAGLTHDLDTGPLTLHLQESAPDQQVGGGGQVEVGLGWERETSDLTIRICNLTGLHLQHQLPLHDIAQVYVKVTVYTNNTILCWRRTSPRALEGQVTVFQEELTLHMPELDLDATHLVLSARLRTKPGCGRRVVGSCVLGCGGCVGEEGRHHWHDMLRAAPDLVLRSHPLAAHAHAHDALPMGPVDPEEDHEGPPSELVDTPHVHYLQGYDGSPSVSSTQTTPTSPPISQTTPTSPPITQSTPISPPITQTTPTSPPI